MFTGILLYMYSSKITSEKLLINILKIIMAIFSKFWFFYLKIFSLWNTKLKIFTIFNYNHSLPGSCEISLLCLFTYLLNLLLYYYYNRYNYIFTLELILTSKLDINKQSLHSQLLQDTNTEDIYSLTLKRSKAHCCLSSIVLITSRQFQQQICKYFLTIYCYNPGFFD